MAYQNEGFDMFNEMIHNIWEDTVKFLYRVVNPEKIKRRKVAEPTITSGEEANKPIVKKGRKVGRNEPCPCGSGKKYKKCCGQ